MCCRQSKDEKGTGAEIVPQLFLGSLLVTHRAVIRDFKQRRFSRDGLQPEVTTFLSKICIA